MERTKHLKLMIVDDHAEIRALIRELIGRFADQILECDNGNDAAIRAADFHPDLVTMDLNIPLTGGLDATRRILATHPAAHVVVISQFDGPEFRLAASSAGASQFFSKSNLAGLAHYVEELEHASSPSGFP
jgi:DNA-binding NarL/FixJ family response regulator